MDPNENLKQQLELAQSMRGSEEDAMELAELVIELDKWLTNGGTPPEKWRAAKDAFTRWSSCGLPMNDNLTS